MRELGCSLTVWMTSHADIRLADCYYDSVQGQNPTVGSSITRPQMLSLIVIRPGWHHHQRLWGGVTLSISTHGMPLLKSKCFVRTNCSIMVYFLWKICSISHSNLDLIPSITQSRVQTNISPSHSWCQQEKEERRKQALTKYYKKNIWLDLNYHTLLIQNSMRAVISCRTKYKAWSMLWHPGEKQPILLIWHPGIINSDFFFSFCRVVSYFSPQAQ